jgi:short-chain fatty acids transporter
MKLIVKFTGFLRKILPSPFSIAVLLTFTTFILALILTPQESTGISRIGELAGYWEKGFWELLAFSMQMMLILVLGYVLAMTKPVNNFINKLINYADTTPKAVFLVAFFTIVFSFLNWGLGLIFGAVFARKTGERFSREKRPLNYALTGAAGYSGLMVWHGGLSGSAPLKIAEKGHFLMDKTGVVPLTDTVFSHMNIIISLALLIILPLFLMWIGKRSKGEKLHLESSYEPDEKKEEKPSGAERLDRSKIFSRILGFAFLFTALYIAVSAGNLKFINLNYINFALFTFAILLNPDISTFLNRVNRSITAASGILIQFPLYAGIMGLMKYSGLFMVFTEGFLKISNQVTLPVYTLLSAGVVNFFVPSGGGQWAVQGPVIVEAAKHLGVPVSKIVMALAYGDEWTNMLQPFWALPLLGITGLKVKEIVPYTFLLFLAGGVIFVAGLLLL